MVENKPYRKYDKCQKCGGELTDEHRFAKYCKKCNPKATVVREGRPPASGEIVLSDKEVEVRFLEYGVSVTCFDCNRQLEIISYKHQPHEMKCPGCGKQYKPEFRVLQILPKGTDMTA